MRKENTNDKKVKLTLQEKEFCELYVYGGSEFAGQAEKCYQEVYGETERVFVSCRRLLGELHVQARIKELEDKLQSETETIATKIQVTETLKSVMEETSSAMFQDRYGMSLSPAPLRAVSVNAAKALMELLPIKHGHDKAKGEGSKGDIVFNVIVPDQHVSSKGKDGE